MKITTNKGVYYIDEEAMEHERLYHLYLIDIRFGLHLGGVFVGSFEQWLEKRKQNEQDAGNRGK